MQNILHSYRQSTGREHEICRLNRSKHEKKAVDRFGSDRYLGTLKRLGDALKLSDGILSGHC